MLALSWMRTPKLGTRWIACLFCCPCLSRRLASSRPSDYHRGSTTKYRYPLTSTLAYTTGEPAGIGPDLIAALLDLELDAELVLIGDRDLLNDRVTSLSTDHPSLTIEHVPLHVPAVAGQLDSRNSSYVLSCLDRAITGCQKGEFDAITTGPVHKGIINDAGIAFTGHTEYLADKTNTSLAVMMLATQDLKVALVTTHLPLSKVSKAITPQRLTQTLTVIDNDLRRHFGLTQPRILVCGLNPHAGENGHLGREEIEIISPALEALRNNGIEITGPVPADTAFLPAQLANHDVVVAMYHDQGLPVIKHTGFEQAVNVTLGLPIIRTSVDHGTALELAGTGQADASSLIAALRLARDLAGQSNRK